ncbi:MAG: N-acetyltransferase family protein [Candidatus Roizmanbacteria bacterium]
MEISVGPAQLKDAPGIAKVHVETWQSAYKGLMPDDYLASLSIEQKTERWKGILSKPEDNADTLVAQADGKIVGFCSVSHCRDEDMSSEIGELWSIYVDKDFSGQGVGSILLDKGLDILREQGYKKATLWVLTTNTKTIKWYESKGWKPEGKTKMEENNGVELQEDRYIIDL